MASFEEECWGLHMVEGIYPLGELILRKDFLTASFNSADVLR